MLDTSVIIDHLRQTARADSLLMEVIKREGKDTLCVSVITIQELYEGESTKSKRKLNEMLAVVSTLTLLDYNLIIAEIAGKLARDSKQPIEFADAAIAATTVFNDFKLYTLDTKHFKGIHGLALYNM